ncbi:tegument protein UL16 [Aotine betaherpesvirus 1]|uniref:Tegument protein UL16 n=1 Tax=Aotine betaherpesvirus 1 TaxID=50290 RepID=G8XUF9_9BETA|nr:tegument protein UL16 [Aotine betaherpesvirus 1]AEV80789.1 tegument protein UL16 [Aotine betaherpesvirus 1]
MASTSVCCTRDLRLLRGFVQNECVWRQVSKTPKSREYVSVACKSATFDPGNGQDNSCMFCRLLLLSRGGQHVFCMAVNGALMGSFTCGRLRRVKYAVAGLDTFYHLQMSEPPCPIVLGFAPSFAPASSTVSTHSLTPDFIYDFCTIVTQEEAKSIVVRGGGEPGTRRAIKLGGPGTWAVKHQTGMDLYFFLLAYDLYTTCTGKHLLPSMAKLMAISTACGEMSCPFCKDHGTHVDPTGRYVGLVPDRGLCFCYAPCRTPTAPITNEEYVPFFCDDANSATHMSVTSAVRQHGLVTLASSLESHIAVYSGSGVPLPLKRACWQLVKLAHPVSSLIVRSCPVVKSVVI